MAKPRYTVYDAANKKWLRGIQKPVEQCDAAVTWWTRNPEKAMRFPGTKSARGIARWLDGEAHGGCLVLNAKGEIV